MFPGGRRRTVLEEVGWIGRRGRKGRPVGFRDPRTLTCCGSRGASGEADWERGPVGESLESTPATAPSSDSYSDGGRLWCRLQDSNHVTFNHLITCEMTI